jgi:hypothetical protein
MDPLPKLGSLCVSYVAEIEGRLKDSPLPLRNYTAQPKTMIVPTAWIKQHIPEAQTMVDSFLSDVADKLQMELRYIDLDDALAKAGWDKNALAKLCTTARNGFCR